MVCVQIIKFLSLGTRLGYSVSSASRLLLCVCRFSRPISVARRVLDHPSLSMLVGSGATCFAKEQGFTLEDNDDLLTQQTRQAYKVN